MATLPATAGALTGFGSSALAAQWAPRGLPMLMGPQIAGLLTGGGIQNGMLTSSPVVSKIIFDANIGNLSFRVMGFAKGPISLYTAGGSLGEKGFALALAKVPGKTLLGTVSTQAGGQIVAKGLPAVLSKVFAFFASVGPVVGTAIGAFVGWAVGKIAEKIPWKKIKEWSAAILGGVAGLIALPFIGLGGALGIGLGTAGISAALGGGLGGLTLSGIGSGIADFFGALGGAFLGAVGTPILVTLLTFPVIVALILFIINSGAYVVPQISTAGITCDATQTAESPAANAAVCIVYYLNKFSLNPLFVDMLDTPSWMELAKVLPSPALEALEISAPVQGHLQCVGFASATAGYAYGQSFGQIDACSYINNPPLGYEYISGTSGIESGDFLLIDGSSGCDNPSPGHIAVVVSVDGAVVSCADANYPAAGEVRVAHGCFALSQITGYLRKN